MPLPEDKVSISVVIDRKVKDELDKYAKLYGISTSKLARNMVYVGLDQFQFLHKMGFGHIAKGLDRFSELFRNLVNSETKKRATKA